MPDTFEINQGARFIFSIVSFPFLSLFRLSVALVKPVVLARFRLFCAWPGFSRKNIAPGLPESDDLRLGRSTASLVLSLFGRISLFPSPAWDSPKFCLLECIHLVGDIVPVLTRYLLLDFFEEVGEVVQAADRRAASVLADRGVLAQGAQQNGTLDVEERDTAMMERQSQFLIGGRKTTLYAAALEKPTFHFFHIASRFVTGSGIVVALVRPEAISDLDDAVRSQGADTLPL